MDLIYGLVNDLGLEDTAMSWIFLIIIYLI